MRIDGTWTRGTLGLPTGEPGDQLEERFAPDPAELLAAGLISHQDQQAHLRLLAARAKRLPAGVEVAGEVIEGQLVEAKPNRARPPGTAAGAVKVVQAVARAAPKVPDRGPRRRAPAEVPMANGANGNLSDLDRPREYQPSPWE